MVFYGVHGYVPASWIMKMCPEVEGQVMVAVKKIVTVERDGNF